MVFKIHWRDGDENVILKVNLRSFSPYIAIIPTHRIPRDHIQVKKEK